MGESMIKYTLPEWTFLNGSSHDGNFLEGRTLLLHFPSFTILEVIPANMLKEFTFKRPTFQFYITDRSGNRETVHFYTHCTLSHNLDRIFQDSAIWYCNYLRWVESNVWIRERSKQN